MKNGCLIDVRFLILCIIYKFQDIHEAKIK